MSRHVYRGVEKRRPLTPSTTPLPDASDGVGRMGATKARSESSGKENFIEDLVLSMTTYHPALRLTRLVVFMLAVLILPYGTLRAYEEAGHFYGAGITIESLNPPLSKQEADLVTFCTWLPDETTELNVVEVYKRLLLHPVDYATWSAPWANPFHLFHREYLGPADTVGSMVVVQQLLHGLTGGESKAVRSVAADVVKKLQNEIASGAVDADHFCALGFALHLVGDSFAHTEIDHPDKIYPTGSGHTRDYTWLDHPLHLLSREKDWEQYLKEMGSFFAPSQPDMTFIGPYEAHALGYVVQHGSESTYFVMDDGESDLTKTSETVLNEVTARRPPAPSFVKTGTPQQCQGYVTRNAGIHPPPTVRTHGIFSNGRLEARLKQILKRV